MKMIGFFVFASVIHLVLSGATNNQDKLNVTVYYESLCPSCRKFIVNQLRPFLQGDLAPLIDLTLIPYGHANKTIKNNDVYEFTCEHGPAECYANKLQACALRLLQGEQKTDDLGYSKEAVEYIICLMDGLNSGSSIADIQTVSDECAAEEKDILRNCANRDNGKKFLAELGRITDHFQKPLLRVPTIVVDQVFRVRESEQAENDFKKIFCSTIKWKNLKTCQEPEALTIPPRSTCPPTVPVPQLMITVLALLGIYSFINRTGV